MIKPQKLWNKIENRDFLMERKLNKNRGFAGIPNGLQYNKLQLKTFWKMIWKRVIPFTAFVVGSSALAFQTMVLHPLHIHLDQQFIQIKTMETQNKRMSEVQKVGLSSLKTMNEKLDYLFCLKAQNNVKSNLIS